MFLNIRFLTFILTASALAFQTGCSSTKLAIESEPSGGNVYINDQLMGKTPLTVEYQKLPYEDNLELRVQKDDYGTYQAIVEGPKQANLGEKIKVKIPKAPDETTVVNQEMERILEAHRLAIAHRFVEATRIADQVIQDHPKLIAPQLLRASIFFLSKNFSSALDQYQKVLELDPTNAEATKMLSYINDKHLQPARAISGGPSQ